MMKHQRPHAISIGGLDPSAGAGIIADVKTFEWHRVIGFGVATAITGQTEKTFHSISWLNSEDINSQLLPLMKNYDIPVAKIGLIRSIEKLRALVSVLKNLNPAIQIIWDPVMKASAGYTFHPDLWKSSLLNDVLKEVYLVTPNVTEATGLTGLPPEEGARQIASFTNIYLKGGHDKHHKGYDVLLQPSKEAITFPPGQVSDYEKHGTGCVLASAMAARLAWGDTLYEACLKAKHYIGSFIHSNQTLLGFHNI